MIGLGGTSFKEFGGLEARSTGSVDAKLECCKDVFVELLDIQDFHALFPRKAEVVEFESSSSCVLDLRQDGFCKGW